MLAPFIDARPTLAVLASVISYGLIATGFPEELLFRGLIAGAHFRRLSFWKANLIQASIFLLPHLLILIVAPQLWALAIFLPLAPDSNKSGVLTVRGLSVQLRSGLKAPSTVDLHVDAAGRYNARSFMPRGQGVALVANYARGERLPSGVRASEAQLSP